MKFDSDVFISYAHLDNQELIEGQKGWVANFHRALEIRVSQLLGKQPDIWRDPKLKGSDFFADTLIEKVRRVAVLLTILSPRYVRSEWTLRELNEFWRSATEAGGISVGDKARVFKVLKTPVPLDMQPAELQRMLGYEFYRVDPETGRVRELDHVFGPEAQRDFWMKVDDVAHDLCATLELLAEQSQAAPGPQGEAAAVYLADTTSDLQAEYESVRRDLQQYGYRVLPARPLPLRAGDLETYLRAELERCKLSIHLVGRNYGMVPEGGTTSVVELQNEMAVERGMRGDFKRFLWMPPGVQSSDPRQQQLIEALRADPKVQQGADLLETPLEELRTVVRAHVEALRQPPKPRDVPAPTVAAAGAPQDEQDDGLTRVYVVCDQRDQDAVTPWGDYLFDAGFEVIPSVFDGDETEVREHHEESLRLCDGVLIYYGAGNETWMRRKLREVQKIAGYGRTRPMRAVAICVAAPATPQKSQLRTREALVIPQMEGLAPDLLQPFVERLKDPRASRSA